MSDQGDNITSKYPVLEKPEFASAIPAHLTAGLSDQEKYLVETLSKMEQQTTWLVSNTLLLNRNVVEVDTEVQELREFKKLLLSKWAIVAWVATVVLPFVLKPLLEALFVHLIK